MYAINTQKLVAISILLTWSSLLFGQVPEIKDLAIYRFAPKEISSLLDELVANDPFIDETVMLIKKQESQIHVKNRLPNPEIGINYSPIPMQKSLNQTVAIRGMQRIAWPGEIKNSVEAEKMSLIELEWNTIQKINERFLSASLIWINLWELQQQEQLLVSHQKFVDTKMSDEKTRLMHQENQVRLIELEMESIELANDLSKLSTKKREEEAKLSEFGISLKRNNFPTSFIFVQSDSSLLNENVIPQIQSLQMKENALNFIEKTKRRNGLPMISLGAEYMFIDEAMRSSLPEMQMQSSLILMANVSLPLFRKQYTGAVNEVNHSKKAIQFEKERMMRKIESQFSLLIEKKNQLNNDLKIYEYELPNRVDQLLRLEEQRLVNSEANFTNWIMLQRKKINLKQKVISIKRELYQTELQLLALKTF